MTEIVVPLNGIRAGVRKIDAAASLMAEITWPTLNSGTPLDSAVRRVVASDHLPTTLDRLVADVRSWTAAVDAAVAACEQSDLRTAAALS